MRRSGVRAPSAPPNNTSSFKYLQLQPISRSFSFVPLILTASAHLSLFFFCAIVTRRGIKLVFTGLTSTYKLIEARRKSRLRQVGDQNVPSIQSDHHVIVVHLSDACLTKEFCRDRLPAFDELSEGVNEMFSATIHRMLFIVRLLHLSWSTVSSHYSSFSPRLITVWIGSGSTGSLTSP